MPEMVRATGGSGNAHPRRCGFGFAVMAMLGCDVGHARAAIPHFDAYFDAFADLHRNDVVAVALTLGVLLFAVVSAIMLVRT